jgi:hypothetical protein
MPSIVEAERANAFLLGLSSESVPASVHVAFVERHRQILWLAKSIARSPRARYFCRNETKLSVALSHLAPSRVRDAVWGRIAGL